MLGIDEKELTSGPKPDDLELVECHEDWSHTGTPQWTPTRTPTPTPTRTLTPTLILTPTLTLTRHAAVGVQRGWTSRGRDVRGATAWSKWPRSQPPMRPPTALEARPLAPGRRLGPRGAPSPLGCRGGAAATFWHLAQPRRSRPLLNPQGASDAQVPAAAHAH